MTLENINNHIKNGNKIVVKRNLETVETRQVAGVLYEALKRPETTAMVYDAFGDPIRG